MPLRPSSRACSLIDDTPLSFLGIDFLDGFLKEHPKQCRTIEQTESHSWILHEITINPEGRENHDASVNDSGVSQEQATQLWFDEESRGAYYY